MFECMGRKYLQFYDKKFSLSEPIDNDLCLCVSCEFLSKIIYCGYSLKQMFS